jgi:hypothetical protein
MWRRKPALKLLVVHPSARKRRSRLRSIRTGDWIPGRRTPARSTARKRAERTRQDEASPPESLILDRTVLEQDSSAFVEALEVPTSGTPQPARKREAARARLELARLVAEADALADDLHALKGALAVGDFSRLPAIRRLQSGRRPAALEAEIDAAQRRLARKQEDLHAARLWTEALEREAEEPLGHSAIVYRLHSANHYVNCSSGQYEHLSAVQRTTPVLLAAKQEWHWWWYRDRFWWVDRKASAREIELTILMMDFSSESQREAFERAQSALAGRNDTASAQDAVPEHVRREVWIRDRGRCVDCGVASSLAFDHLLSIAVGGSNTARNIELRCRPCQLRRRANESRATVGKARIGAHAAREWGVEVKDISWPRPLDGPEA